MLDLSSEAVRLALMEQAGCDEQRCGLAWSVNPHSDTGSMLLTHHWRLQATGPSEVFEDGLVIMKRSAKATVAWMKRLHTIYAQHTEPDDE